METEILIPVSGEEIHAMVKELESLLRQAAEGLVKAGSLVVSLVDRGVTLKEIASHSEILTEQIVGRFEQIGRKMIYPALLFNDFPANSNVCRLPYSEQKRLMSDKEPIEMMVVREEGKVDVLKVEVTALTYPQCRQVFDAGLVRTPAEQRAWLESEKMLAAKKSVPAGKSDYTAHRGYVIINCPRRYTAAQIRRMLREMGEVAQGA